MVKGIESKIVLIGEAELKRFLRELPKKAVKKGLRAAVNAGANPIMKGVKAAVPVKTGTMQRAVKKKVKSYPTGNAIALVGADKAVSSSIGKKKNVPANYWHLVIGGVRPHSLGKGSQLKRHDRNNKEIQHGDMHPGFKGTDTLAKVMAAEAGKSRKLMEDKLADVLTKEAAKLAK